MAWVPTTTTRKTETWWPQCCGVYQEMKVDVVFRTKEELVDDDFEAALPPMTQENHANLHVYHIYLPTYN